jgi:PAS domain S-box-containing protein
MTEFEFLKNIENSNDINIHIDFDIEGNIIFVNDDYLTFFCQNKIDILGVSIYDVVSGKEREDLYYYWPLIISGDSYKSIGKRVLNGLKDKWLLGKYTPIFDLNGNISKVTYNAVDVTLCKEIEHEMVDIHDRLKEFMSGKFHINNAAEVTKDISELHYVIEYYINKMNFFNSED